MLNSKLSKSPTRLPTSSELRFDKLSRLWKFAFPWLFLWPKDLCKFHKAYCCLLCLSETLAHTVFQRRDSEMLFFYSLSCEFPAGVFLTLPICCSLTSQKIERSSGFKLKMIIPFWENIWHFSVSILGISSLHFQLKIGRCDLLPIISHALLYGCVVEFEWHTSIDRLYAGLRDMNGRKIAPDIWIFHFFQLINNGLTTDNVCLFFVALRLYFMYQTNKKWERDSTSTENRHILLQLSVHTSSQYIVCSIVLTNTKHIQYMPLFSQRRELGSDSSGQRGRWSLR